MTLLADIQALVSSSQWNFVYNLIILMAVEATLGVAYVYWRRSGNERARRLVWGTSALLLVRLAPLVWSLLTLIGAVDTQVAVSSLERALGVISLAIVAWTFIPAGGYLLSVATPFLWTNVGLAMLTAVALTLRGSSGLAGAPQPDPVDQWPHYLWASWQLLICVLGGYTLLRSPQQSRERGALLTFFTLGALGQLLALSLPVTTSFPMWERLTSLLMYPFLAVITYQITHVYAGLPESESLALPLGAGNVTEFLLSLFESVENQRASDESATESQSAEEPQTQFARKVVMPVTRALGVDQVAIGLLEGEQGDRMRLVAIHNPLRQGRGGEVVSFPLDEQLAIRRALRRQEMVLVGGADDIVQLKFLYALMGSGETGPLLVQPLLYRGRTIGALIAGNSASKQPFSFATTQLTSILASFISELLVGPQLVRKLEKALAEKEQLLDSRQGEWGARLESLDTALQQERESAQLFAGRMSDLERANRSKDTELDRLSRRLLLQEEAARRSQQEAAALSKKLEALARTKVGLEDEIRGYREQIVDLEQLLSKREGQPYERG
jgi:hypothetical protein